MNPKVTRALFGVFVGGLLSVLVVGFTGRTNDYFLASIVCALGMVVVCRIADRKNRRTHPLSGWPKSKVLQLKMILSDWIITATSITATIATMIYLVPQPVPHFGFEHFVIMCAIIGVFIIAAIHCFRHTSGTNYHWYDDLFEDHMERFGFLVTTVSHAVGRYLIGWAIPIIVFTVVLPVALTILAIYAVFLVPAAFYVCGCMGLRSLYYIARQQFVWLYGCIAIGITLLTICQTQPFLTIPWVCCLVSLINGISAAIASEGGRQILLSILESHLAPWGQVLYLSGDDFWAYVHTVLNKSVSPVNSVIGYLVGDRPASNPQTA